MTYSETIAASTQEIISPRELGQRRDLARDFNPGLAQARERLTQWAADIGRFSGTRGAVALFGHLKRQLCQFYAQDKQAVQLWVKQALRRSPDWQARVFADLGGEGALARWQDRLAKSFRAEPEDDYAWLDDDPATWPIPEPKPIRLLKPRGQGRQRFKTDRDGLFRWAIIRVGRNCTERAPEDYLGRYSGAEELANPVDSAATAARPLAGPWPIELLPSDMIDEADEEEDETGGDFTPLTLWAALHAKYEVSFAHLDQFISQRREAKAALVLLPP